MEDKEDVRVQGLNTSRRSKYEYSHKVYKGYIIMTCWSTTPDLGLAGMDARRSDTPLAIPSDIPLPLGTLPTAHQAFHLLLTIHHTPYRPPATHSKVELKKRP